MNKSMSRNKQKPSQAQNKQNAGTKQANLNGSKVQSDQGQSKQAPKNTQVNQNASRGQQAPRSAQAARRAAQQAAKEQQRRQEQRVAARTRSITLFSIIGAIVVVVAVIVGAIYLNRNNNTTETIVNPSYPPVSGIYCSSGEQLAYHIHAHVSIYINGKLNPIPQYVGIASDGSCLYWLHTHYTDGIIHIESPTEHTYMFGNFLDEWSAHFSSLGYPPELDLTSGWQVWINGQPYTGNFRNIPLTAHQLITMAYDSQGVKPDTTYNWNGL